MKRPDVSITKPAITKVGPFQFIRQVVEELKKVTWPTRKETIKLTLIILGVSTVVGIYIGGLDYLLTNLFALVFGT